MLLDKHRVTGPITDTGTCCAYAQVALPKLRDGCHSNCQLTWTWCDADITLHESLDESLPNMHSLLSSPSQCHHLMDLIMVSNDSRNQLLHHSAMYIANCETNT